MDYTHTSSANRGFFVIANFANIGVFVVSLLQAHPKTGNFIDNLSAITCAATWTGLFNGVYNRKVPFIYSVPDNKDKSFVAASSVIALGAAGDAHMLYQGNYSDVSPVNMAMGFGASLATAAYLKFNAKRNLRKKHLADLKAAFS